MRGRKFISILFFVCLAAPFVGSFLWLQHEKHQVRRTIKRRIIAGMDRDDLVLLKFTEEQAENLRWKHSMEFEYNGDMYDIVERSQRGDTLYFWCWWDFEETRLNRQLSRLVAGALGQDKQNRENHQRLCRYIKNVFQEGERQLLPSLETLENEHRFTYSENYVGIVTNPPSPPPKIEA